MQKISKKELKTINEKFKGLDNFLKFYANLLQMEEEDAGFAPIEFDKTPYTSDGIVTGIIMSVEANRRTLKVEMLMDECHRIFKLDKIYTKKILDLQKEMLTERATEEAEKIKSFGFLKYKPFLVTVQDNVVIELTPLDWNLYEQYYSTFEELMMSKH